MFGQKLCIFLRSTLLKCTTDVDSQELLQRYSFFPLTLAQSSETPEKTSCDDDDGDDEKLKALAKKFEEKYVSCNLFTLLKRVKNIVWFMIVNSLETAIVRCVKFENCLQFMSMI